MNKPEQQWGGKDTYMTPHARRIPSSGLEEIETSESRTHRLNSKPGRDRTYGWNAPLPENKPPLDMLLLFSSFGPLGLGLLSRDAAV